MTKSGSSDRVWVHKPWWCQPWSILLTGFTIIGGLYRLGGICWWTILLSLPILVWMVFFVGIYPRLYSRMQSET